MVGSALVRKLKNTQECSILTASKQELDLTDQNAVAEFFSNHQINEVYLAAAKVGGIYANNNFPADFIYQNIMMQANLINAAHNSDIEKLLFLGSSCIYPKKALQPMNESALLSGYLEPTNEPYALAKIAGIKLCESYNRQHGRDYRCIMPTNLYGQGDNFHEMNSHVVPALIRRFHEAKLNNLKYVEAWGTGKPKREFLHVDDMASASIYVMKLDKILLDKYIDPMNSHINIGAGNDISIKDLTIIIASIVGYQGEIRWDKSKPDGPPRKLLDCKLIENLGWKPSISLIDGLKSTYKWFLNQKVLRY